jgi:hypothetical protein
LKSGSENEHPHFKNISEKRKTTANGKLNASQGARQTTQGHEGMELDGYYREKIHVEIDLPDERR